MSRARLLLLTVFLFLLCSPAFSVEESLELNSKCEELVKSLEVLTPETRQIAYFNRTHRFVPWVGTREEVIELGQYLDPSLAQNVAARLEDVQRLLIELRDNGKALPSRLRTRLMETVARATSAYYSTLRIPHSVERFTTVLGQKHWRIKVSPQNDFVSPMVEMAHRLSTANVSLQIDFHLLTSNRAAAFEEGSGSASPFLDSRLFFLRNGLLNDLGTESRLTLPFRMAYVPDAVNSSVGVSHELRHLENSLRKINKQDFPFYGAAVFPFGLTEFFNREPEKSSLFMKLYGRYFSLDENDTTLENFFNIRRIIDDPLASFNRELGESSLEREFRHDIQNLTMANKLSLAIAQAVLSQLEKTGPERKVEFSEKSGLVWAKMFSALDPDSFKTTFVLMIPLVKAQPEQNQEEKVQALRQQMEFLVSNLQNRSKFVEWLHTADDLRNGMEFENKTYKDFLRVFLSALVHPGFTNQPDFKPFTWDRQSRAYRRATLGPRRR